MTAEYPPHWEADVVLADGGTVHVRPIAPHDADGLVALHARLSAETIRYRFFAAHPRLSEKEIARFTQVDYDRRVALVAVLGGELIAVGRFEGIPDSEVAEVAFVVDDAHQGRGLGSVLLEHLAAIAAERGIRRFEADVLSDNARMVRVFVDAGYAATQAYEQDTIHLVFPVEPTSASVAVMQSREHRSEARSIQRLLNARSVAVVGAGRDPDSVGHMVLTNILRYGFQGPVYPVNPHARHVASIRAYPSVEDVPDEIDAAVLAVPPAAMPEVITQCARKRVRTLIVMSGGYSEIGPAGATAERSLVAAARANGMRLVGPNCLGVICTDPDVRLNVTTAAALPDGGTAAFFCQSGALGAPVLESVIRRGLGLSAFVSVGNRGDVNENDLLQYWEDDPATELVLLYVESLHDPRKFARLARRLGRRKPIVAVKSGGEIAARLEHAKVPEQAVDALFRQAGVIRVDTLPQLFDVAQLLTWQPLPQGRRVAVVANSVPLGELAASACAGGGLPLAAFSPETLNRLRSSLGPDVLLDNPLVLPAGNDPAPLGEALATVLGDPAVDAVVTVLIPGPRLPTGLVARTIADASSGCDKPVVSTFLAVDRGARDGALPDAVVVYPSPEEAVSALARTAAYAQWRQRPEGTLPVIDGIDPDAARGIVAAALDGAPDGRPLADEAVRDVLAAYGISVYRSVVCASADDAAAAALELGYPVALKATAPPLRHRPELGTMRLDLGSEEQLRAAYQSMNERLGGSAARLAVQAMAPPGVATVLRVEEDPSFGALVSFGLGGVATDLLGDRAFRIIPLTDLDAAELVRSVHAAPILFGYRGSEPVDVAAVERLLLRVARLADDLPEVVALELNPVVVATSGLSVLGATAGLARPPARLDTGPRRLY
jgi:acyl-CoA synthetase (NDP forming)/GNAT superfamily N-acetyltransferase